MDTKSSHWVQKPRRIFVHFASLTAVLILYGAFFSIPLPPQFRRQGIFLTDEFIFLALLALVFLTFHYPGQGARYLRFGLILISFTLPLLRLWQTAESTWNVVLGLLPWADATDYYFDASRLLDGGLFSAFSGRRPLFASLFATLLKLSHQNLQITIIIFTIITALAVFLFIEEVHYALGAVSAVAALFLSQLFYRPFVGTTLTEQLGIPVGLLAVVVLMRSVRTSKAWLFSLGLMFLTYALLVRAGTFFVLPVLVLFAIFHFGESRKQYLIILLIMAIAVAIPILSNAWLGKVVASPGAVAFANFADTLYGQARGGVRWTQAAIDHPELASMGEPKRSEWLYRLAFEEIKRHPLGLAKGSVKAWVDFVLPGPQSAFGFLTFGNRTIDFVLQVSAALVFIAGLWLLWKDRRRPIARLMLIFWLGIFISIPFLPPIDAGIRPYAATIALLFLTVCFIFSTSFFQRYGQRLEIEEIPVSVSYILAFTLIGVALIGAPLIVKTFSSIHLPSADCDPNLIPISFKLNRGSFIMLTPAEDGHETRVPYVRLADVHRSLDDFPYGDFASIVRKLKRPALIAVATDIPTARGIWIFAPAELEKFENKTISACAEMTSSTYPVMFIKTIENP